MGEGTAGEGVEDDTGVGGELLGVAGAGITLATSCCCILLTLATSLLGGKGRN